MTLKDRIIKFIEFKGLTTQNFEKIVGLSNAAVSKMGDNTRRTTLDKISNHFPELNQNWLLTGEGEMLKDLPEEKEIDTPEAMAATISYASGVPYYDETFECGFDELTPSSVINPNFYIRMPGYERATLWCNASGQSMAPEISNGDIIALQLVADPSFLPFGDIYAIVTTNDMRTIKRLGRSDLPDHYRLIPTNPAFEPQDIPMRMIRTVYKVLGAMKSFI